MRKRLLFHILFGVLALNSCFVTNDVGALNYTTEARVGKVERFESESDRQETSAPDTGSYSSDTESAMFTSAGDSVILVSVLAVGSVLLVGRYIARKK